MNLDETIRNSVKAIDFPVPIFDGHLWGVSFFVWKKPEFYVDPIETEPYKLDGEMPMLMVKVAWFEIMFENKFIYRLVYKRRHGFEPLGLT